MTAQDTGRVTIQPAGSPGVASLEVRGTILIFRRRSWVAAFSAYLPVEWLEQVDAQKLDWQRLWQGIIASLIAILFILPLGLCYRFRILLNGTDSLWLVPMAIILAGVLAFSAQRVLSFFQRRAYTQLHIPGAGRVLRIRFWRDELSETENDDLETLLATLRERSQGIQRGTIPPLHINHSWYQPDPYRMAFFKGVVISFFLYLGLLSWAVALFLSGRSSPSPWLFLILAAPPLAHLIGALLRDLDAIRAPADFRRARRYYRRGALEATRDALDTALEIAPEELPARILMVRVCAELGKLEEALIHCAKLSKDKPHEAAHLEKSLWAMRRLHARMEQSSTAVE